MGLEHTLSKFPTGGGIYRHNNWQTVFRAFADPTKRSSEIRPLISDGSSSTSCFSARCQDDLRQRSCSRQWGGGCLSISKPSAVGAMHASHHQHLPFPTQVRQKLGQQVTACRFLKCNTAVSTFSTMIVDMHCLIHTVVACVTTYLFQRHATSECRGCWSSCSFKMPTLSCMGFWWVSGKLNMNRGACVQQHFKGRSCCLEECTGCNDRDVEDHCSFIATCPLYCTALQNIYSSSAYLIKSTNTSILYRSGFSDLYQIHQWLHIASSWTMTGDVWNWKVWAKAEWAITNTTPQYSFSATAFAQLFT